MDRLLGMKLVPNRRLVRRNVSYDFMNRQMVWHSFTVRRPLQQRLFAPPHRKHGTPLIRDLVGPTGIPRVPRSPPSSPQTPTRRRDRSGCHNASAGHAVQPDSRLCKFGTRPRDECRERADGCSIPRAGKVRAPPRGRMCDMLRKYRHDAKHRGRYPASVDF